MLLSHDVTKIPSIVKLLNLRWFHLQIFQFKVRFFTLHQCVGPEVLVTSQLCTHNHFARCCGLKESQLVPPPTNQPPGKGPGFPQLRMLTGRCHSWFISFQRSIIQKWQCNIEEVIKTVFFLINQRVLQIYIKYIWSLVISFCLLFAQMVLSENFYF